MIEILTMPQGSPEWVQARLGLPTASEFADVMAKGKGLVRRGYLMRLAAERITGEPQERYSNARMRQGKELEAEARDLYAYLESVRCGGDLIEPQLVGLIKNGIAGYSPDGLIGDCGLLEIKTLIPPLMVGLLSQGGYPPEHKAQLQGGLWVSNRGWIDFVGYWPGMPLHVVRVGRDEDYIAELSNEVERFAAELDDVVRRVGISPKAALRDMMESSLEVL